jgi:hypothetical protein
MYFSRLHSAYLLGWCGTAGATLCSLGITIAFGSIGGGVNSGAGVGSLAFAIRS